MNPPPLLVLGFGPFLEIRDNPAEQLARAVDGALEGRIAGRVMPVSYTRCLETTRQAIRTHAPAAVIGVGVARSRTTAQLERLAHGACNDVPDVDGVCGSLRGAPRTATLPTAFVDALGLEPSDDAGRYVCNAWLYGALDLHPHVGFLHVPPEGFDAERLVTAWATAARGIS